MYPTELENATVITSRQKVVLSDVVFDVGEIGSRFFAELRDGPRIMGVRCPVCLKIYVPPRPTCAGCFEPLSDWVEVSPEGTLLASTTVYAPVANPPAEPPYTLAVVRLDGADTGIVHLVDEVDPARLTEGTRVRAVFREAREGNIRDIEHFEITG
ncbi:MAG: Zn-ribbon domain-containing OB-fold protein [Actinobacteria bacterium]|nr:Zn-ribbon domain-containing OB-fold protein [Actinomycetota bacterium]MBU1943011.1 Zn-ribbon domain-containing OB-fold protein [Actinomycetota bacterium]MBU2687749.1 Zn-ribbon domain-containing OB-fold protein [Actinomycetota bacterium]